MEGVYARLVKGASGGMKTAPPEQVARIVERYLERAARGAGLTRRRGTPMPLHIPRRRASEDESGIDLTPMLDVVFIMLIFFIVTASFVKEAGIHVARPQAQQVGDPGTRSILLTVTAGQRDLARRAPHRRALGARQHRAPARRQSARPRW